MDDRGYAVTPLAFLLMVPVVLIAFSFGGIVDELNNLSALFIGGDVTATIANDLSNTIKVGVVGAGRRSALLAVETVINNTNLSSDNYPFFNKTGTNTSKAFIKSETLNMLNINLTYTCRVLSNETGRSIYVKNKNDGNYVYIDPEGTDTVEIFQNDDMDITQDAPFGFNITLEGLHVKVVQNSNTSAQSMDLNLPKGSYFITIEGLEDPYIWVNAKERNSSVIYAYSHSYDNYHFDDIVSQGRLNYLYEALDGMPNATIKHPYYFQYPWGLSFFDRLENNTNSNSDPSTRISTFILWDPLAENHGYAASMLDIDYFNAVEGGPIITERNKNNRWNVTCPNGQPFIISDNSITRLGLQRTYSL